MIIRAWNGECDFPKGHIENSESEYETATRELKEETNIEVRMISNVKKQKF